jgi:hypothetical protein
VRSLSSAVHISNASARGRSAVSTYLVRPRRHPSLYKKSSQRVAKKNNTNADDKSENNISNRHDALFVNHGYHGIIKSVEYHPRSDEAKNQSGDVLNFQGVGSSLTLY